MTTELHLRWTDRSLKKGTSVRLEVTLSFPVDSDASSFLAALEAGAVEWEMTARSTTTLAAGTLNPGGTP